MKTTASFFILLILLAVPYHLIGDVPATVTMHGLRLPAGFEATLFADDQLAADIHCLTLDPTGRVVVSGRGYLRVLIDEDEDGKADRALDFRDAPRDGAHGLFWEKSDLYCVGDGGLRVYRNADGVGRHQPSQLLFRCRTGSEHMAHTINRGPDGWMYLLVGDQTRIGKEQINSATSPITDPIGGCILRFSPDFSLREIVADGFRNPYAMDWNADGELFTFDSDNERCVSLPWYEPTRCYHVLSGGHHGWLTPQHAVTWRCPPYFLDIVPAVAYLGRGSPTGVVCYRHVQFPAHYRGGLFLLDWTFGQIHFVQLHRKGSSYAGKPEVFLRSVGDNGFAPVAAAVHPRTGDLYVAIGGRGTRGAVYRIRHSEGLKKMDLRELARFAVPERSLELKRGDETLLLRQTRDKDYFVRRRALELILRHHKAFTAEQLVDLFRSHMGETDRGLRRLAAQIWTSVDSKHRHGLELKQDSPAQRITMGLAQPSEKVVDLLHDPEVSSELRLDATRIVQLVLGDLGAGSAKGTVWEGYSRRSTQAALSAKAKQQLRDAFPSGKEPLDREVSRTLALCEDDDPRTMKKVVDKLTERSDPIDDIHYLIVLSKLRAERGRADTLRTADAIIRLDEKIEQRALNRDRNWPLRLSEIYGELSAKDKALNLALLEHPDFGRPSHALFCRSRGFDRARAARRFLERSKEPGFVWQAELIDLMGELPSDSSLKVMRKLWGEHGLDEVILPYLAKHAQPEDRSRFLNGLASANLTTLASSLSAVEKLPLPTEEERREEVFALGRALRQLTSTKEEEKLRARVLVRLSKVSGITLSSRERGLDWIVKKYPELASRLEDSDGVDYPAWVKRLAGIKWDKGDVKRGRAVYVKASCALCHSGVVALGPDLKGVTARFSRDDLFTAILRPSKDVSPRYRTTQLTTTKGQVYQGIIVYEAVDSVLMLTGVGQSIRLAHTQLSDRKLTNSSLMPAGLLDRLKDEEIADLYSYLKSLEGP